MGYPSRIASGYDENGWDWNRLPGTTTIHLPFELLDSPLPGTTMAHSKEKLLRQQCIGREKRYVRHEANGTQPEKLTPDFVARKSVFCFDNRMICLGTGISNSNASFQPKQLFFKVHSKKGKPTFMWTES